MRYLPALTFVARCVACRVCAPRKGDHTRTTVWVDAQGLGVHPQCIEEA